MAGSIQGGYRRALLGAVAAMFACGGGPVEGGGTGESSGTTGSTATEGTTASTTMPSTGPLDGSSGAEATTATTATTTATTATADSTGDAGEASSDDGPIRGALFDEDFDGADGAPWPAPWTIVGDNVIAATLQGGRGALAGVTGGTARVALPGFAELDSDSYVSVEFTQWPAQGFGFYARQNGGALTQTDPPGQGYALFVEGFLSQSLGVWREVDGVETIVATVDVPIPGGLTDQLRYRMRFQVEQMGAQTALRGKLWLASDPEPAAWAIDVVDDTPVLQDQTGSFAVDAYNNAGMQNVYADDLVIYPL